MGFKTDREFLRNLTVGAIGTRRVAEMLRSGGCEVIELERYSQSNKIWATKVKRLRVPDLLCLRCGTRTESRAKSSLAITMSHALNNPERAWDKGLRDHDLVACIKCTVDEGFRWQASDELTLFTVGALRATRHLAMHSRMKATSEGSEVYLTWPTIVPKRSGEVVSVTKDTVKVRFDAGKRYTYRLVRRSRGQQTSLQPHVQPGDRFGEGSRVIASVMPRTVPAQCQASGGRYDFLSDLSSKEREIVYGAVKALGYIADARDLSIDALRDVVAASGDALMVLEAAGSLARLGDERGWEEIEAATESADAEVQMESVLVLSELPGPRSADILAAVARDRSNASELRAAASWGLGSGASTIENTPLLELITDSDEITAVHAIVAAARLMTEQALPSVVSEIGQDPHRSAGIVKALQIAPSDPLPHALARLNSADTSTRNWLAYLMASLGRERCAPYLALHAPGLLEELEFFWRYHNENWTNRLDIADEIDFLLGQVLD